VNSFGLEFTCKYIVQIGDTIESVAYTHQVHPNALKYMKNKMPVTSDPSLFVPGAMYFYAELGPCKSFENCVYQVKSNDTIESIAVKHQVYPNALKYMKNKMPVTSDPSLFVPGAMFFYAELGPCKSFENCVYHVKPGDTFQSIANKLNINPDYLYFINRHVITDINKLYGHMKLKYQRIKYTFKSQPQLCLK